MGDCGRRAAITCVGTATGNLSGKRTRPLLPRRAEDGRGPAIGRPLAGKRPWEDRETENQNSVQAPAAAARRGAGSAARATALRGSSTTRADSGAATGA